MQGLSSALRKALADTADIDKLKRQLADAQEGLDELAVIRAMAKATQAEFSSTVPIQQAVAASGGEPAVVEIQKVNVMLSVNLSPFLFLVLFSSDRALISQVVSLCVLNDG